MHQDVMRIRLFSSDFGRNSTVALASVSAILVPIIFALDILRPLDVVFSILYVAPIVLTLVRGTARATYFVFVITSVATVVAATFTAIPAEPTAAIANRALALVAQALAAALVIQQLELREGDRERGTLRETQAEEAHTAAVRAETRAGAMIRMLHGLPDAMFMVDADGLIVDANEGAEALLRLPRAVFMGQNWQVVSSTFTFQLPGGKPLASDLAIGGWPRQGPHAISGELVIARGDSSDLQYCIVTAAALHEGGDVSGGLVIAQDTTAVRVRERQKDDFISMATHELRTPISTLRGYAQLTESAAVRAGVPDIAATAGKIVRQSDRLNRLVADLLDVSRIQNGQIELRRSDVPIASMISDAVEHQQAVHPDRAFALDIQSSPALIHADGHRVEQVMTNLLDNAVKYSPDGGDIVVRMGAASDHVRVSVADTGIGIPREEQDRLFQRFYRAKSGSSRFSGLGVGLYISYRIVRAHGGRMWVESSGEGGSTFIFTLPIGDSSPRPAMPNSA
jgi:two-component system, OmpR family, phosphate regulon sensor histidine kinase PhoR